MPTARPHATDREPGSPDQPPGTRGAIASRDGSGNRARRPGGPPRARRSALLFPAAVLAALVLAVYFPVLGHDFVHWDDDVYVFENPRVLFGLDAGSAAWALTALHEGTWQPLTWLSYLIDASGGVDPRRFHATNLALQVAAALLLFFALRRLLRDAFPTPGVPVLLSPAFLAGALFAVHPLNVEVVAWVSARKDLLAAVCWFLAILLYARYAERPQPRRMLPVAVVFLLGLMAKPVVMTLPVILLVLDFWPLARIARGQPPQPAGRSPGRPSAGATGRNPRGVEWRALLLEKAPLLAFSAASLVVTFVAQRRVGAVGTLQEIPIGERLTNATLSYVLYLRDAILPARLAAFYPYVPVGIGPAAAAGVALAAVTFLGWRLRRRHPYLLAGWLWYIITLAPMSGLVQVGSHARADRFAYLPLTGIFLAAVCGGHELVRALRARAAASARSADAGAARTSRVDAAAAVGRIAAGCAALLIGAAGVAAHVQARTWRDDPALWNHALRVTDGNYLAHMKLGAVLAQSGDRGKALEHFREALRISPDYLDAWYNYATVLSEPGKREESIAAFETGLRLRPGDPRLRQGLARTWNNRGVDEAESGRMEEAIRSFEEAVRTWPEDAAARQNLERARAAASRPPAPAAPSPSSAPAR